VKRSWVLALLGVLLMGAPVLAADNLSGTITVWSWDVAAEALRATIPSFNEKYPNVKVDVIDLGNQNVFDRGLAGCAAGGVDLPDVYSIENNEAEVFWSRFPECWTDLRTLGAEELLDEFPDFKWAELIHDGKIYAIPWDSGPVVVFYRRDLYEAAGIDPAQIQTWDDFIEAGKKMLAATDGRVRMATISLGSDDEFYRMLVNQAGGWYWDETVSYVTVHQEPSIRAFETIKKMYDAGILAVGGWNEQIQYFKNGVVASSLFGSWYEGTIRQNAPEQEGLWGVYLMPAFEPGGPRAANLGGSALAIPASSKNKEAAWAFVRHALATTEGQITMLEQSGLTPSYLPALDHPYVAQPQPYWGNQAIWLDILGTLEQVPPARGTQFFEEARRIVTAILADYVGGRYATAEEALNVAARQISMATGLPIAP